MNSLSLCFAALILAYSLTSAQESCADAIKKCGQGIAGGDSTGICSKLRTFLDCGKNVTSNGGSCTSQQLASFQSEIDKQTTNFKIARCSGAETLMTSLLLSLGLSGVAYFLTALK